MQHQSIAVPALSPYQEQPLVRPRQADLLQINTNFLTQPQRHPAACQRASFVGIRAAYQLVGNGGWKTGVCTHDRFGIGQLGRCHAPVGSGKFG